jgi:hypothetical protein
MILVLFRLFFNPTLLTSLRILLKCFTASLVDFLMITLATNANVFILSLVSVSVVNPCVFDTLDKM